MITFLERARGRPLPDQQLESLWKISEVAKLLKVTRGYLTRKKDLLPPIRVSDRGHPRYHPADVAAFFENLRGEPVNVEQVRRAGPLLTVQEAAELVNFQRQVFGNWIRRGFLKPYVLGLRGEIRIDPTELQSLIHGPNGEAYPYVSIKPLLTIETVARNLAVHPNTLRGGIDGLPEWWVGGLNRRRYDPRDVAAYCRGSIRQPRVEENSIRMLSVRDVARLVGVHTNTVRMWANKGIIDSVRIGTRQDRRFHRADVEEIRTYKNEGDLIGSPERTGHGNRN